MSESKKEKMLRFWSERVDQYGADPRSNTADVWLREVEIPYVNRVIQENGFRKVLDFGCANGFTTSRLAELNPDVQFLGIDINPKMIEAAKDLEQRPNLSFMVCDVLTDALPDKFDLIYAIRAFQNLESLEMQKRIADRLIDALAPGGALLYLEMYVEGYAQLNSDRADMGLPALPIHEHLTMLTPEFDEYISDRLQPVKRDAVSSSYYLMTRLLYSFIAKMNKEPIDYNHPIHQVAAIVPQVGDYGPQRACLYKKK